MKGPLGAAKLVLSNCKKDLQNHRKLREHDIVSFFSLFLSFLLPLTRYDLSYMMIALQDLPYFRTLESIINLKIISHPPHVI